MAAQNTNPFYGSSNGGMSASSDHRRLALDNLLRRELKVSDPNDPAQIAQALLSRYKNDPRANAIAQEASGLPFLMSASGQIPTAQAPSSSNAELQQAIDDVERDIRELTTNSLLKDVTAELEGWAQAVRTAIAEGTTAARFSLDPRQRDKTFGIRRTLGGYARLARLVGALTPTLSLTYRKFAQSLDELSSVLLVMMGEALANIGFNGGRYLMQVPYSDLQVRRDSVINALRNLTGAAPESYGQNYSWGLHAYRQLYASLEKRGQGELRSLLVENELSRSMDELIQRASHGSSEGLRQLGVTAELQLERFRRLIVIAQSEIEGDLPPLTSFLDSLLLFINAFETSGGFRLMRIARPPILFYGLYGNTGLGKGEERLLRLVLERNLLSEKLDCFLRCECSEEAIRCQILLDKVLYDVDRSIDLYAVGIEELGEPEFRASAYSYLIDAVLEQSDCNKPEVVKEFPQDNLKTIRDLLRPNKPNDPLWSQHTFSKFDELSSNSTSRKPLEQELCLQFDAESRLKSTVRTMAPECLNFDQVFKSVSEVLEVAIEKLSSSLINIDTWCKPIEVSIPATEASSQTRIANILALPNEQGLPREAGVLRGGLDGLNLLSALNQNTNEMLGETSSSTNYRIFNSTIAAMLTNRQQVSNEIWQEILTKIVGKFFG